MDFNVLIDGYPISYKGYRVRTNYKIGILLSQAMSDETIEDDLRLFTGINLLFIDKPEDPLVALKGIQWFLSCGKSEMHEEKEEDNITDIIVDYDYDQLDIAAAFKIHHIDLNDKLHYWEFCSLLPNLKDTTLSQKMQFRSTDLSKLKGETKKYYSEMKNKYRVHRVLSEEEWEEYQNKLRETRGSYYMKLKAALKS